MTRRALVLVHRRPERDGAFAEALRMSVGLTLGVAEVRVVLDGPALVPLFDAETALPDEQAVRRYLSTLSDLGVDVLCLHPRAADHGLEHCTPERLAELVGESDATVVW